MTSRAKTKQNKSEAIVAYSEGAVRNNAAIVEYYRISMSALSGGTAGLLGLTSFHGFAFFIFAVVGLWAMLLLKAGGQWKKYFISRRSLLTSGFFGNLFVSFLNRWLLIYKLFQQIYIFFLTHLCILQTYVLFWTFLYGMVHVY